MLTITKTKLSDYGNDGIVLSYNVLETNGQRRSVSGDHYKIAVSDEIKKGYEGLGRHLSIMCGYVAAPLVKDIDNCDDVIPDGFHCTGFAIGGKELNGLVLTGHFSMPNGKTVILNSPYRLYDEDEKTRYPFMEDLKERVNLLDNHIRLYMDMKVTGPVQGVLPLGDDGKITHMQIADTAKPGELGTFKGKPAHVQLAEAMNGGRVEFGNTDIAQEEPTPEDLAPDFSFGAQNNSLQLPPLDDDDPEFEARERMQRKVKEQPGHIPQADPEAMKRVQAGFDEDKKNKPITDPAQVAEDIVRKANEKVGKAAQEANKNKEAAPPKKKNSRRVAQSPDAPSGIVED